MLDITDPVRLSDAAFLPTVRLASIDFNGLIMQDKSTVLASVTALTTIGALQIQGIPGFLELREDTLGNLHECMAFEASSEVIMKDGSRRRTIAIGSKNGVPDLWDRRRCGGAEVEHMHKLRAVVDAATRLLFNALDLSTKRSSKAADNVDVYAMNPYESFVSIFDNGEHLEHFHTYYPSQQQQQQQQEQQQQQQQQKHFDDRSATMDFHTDSGLLIAMTTGFYRESKFANNSITGDVRGLYIEMPTGDKARVDTDDDSLIILVGRGGADWLNSAARIGRSLRAMPHALIAGLDAEVRSISDGISDGISSSSSSSSSSSRDGGSIFGSTRSWYGKMFQPPHNAWISNRRDNSNNPLTYSVLRTLEIESFLSKRASFASNSSLASLPAACSDYDYNHALRSNGEDDSRVIKSTYLEHYNAGLASNDLCVTSAGKVGLYCWMQCQNVEDLVCGHEAYCYDEVNKQVVPGDITCPSGSQNCKLECVPDNPSDKSQEISFEGYCYGSGASMIMAGFTSVALERLGSTPCLNLLFTSWTLNSKLKYFFACTGTFFLGIVIQYISKSRSERAKENIRPSVLGNAVVLILFGTQMILSYYAMLVAMTYSVELFSMVIAGLTVGFGVFNLKRPAAESIEPCCNYSAAEFEESEGLSLQDHRHDRSNHKFEKIDD